MRLNSFPPSLLCFYPACQPRTLSLLRMGWEDFFDSEGGAENKDKNIQIQISIPRDEAQMNMGNPLMTDYGFKPK